MKRGCTGSRCAANLERGPVQQVTERGAHFGHYVIGIEEDISPWRYYGGFKRRSTLAIYTYVYLGIP